LKYRRIQYSKSNDQRYFSVNPPTFFSASVRQNEEICGNGLWRNQSVSFEQALTL
jgi:hypothetical protein